MLAAQLGRGPDALVGERRRHPDVQDDRVRRGRPDRGEQLGAARHRGGDLGAGCFEQQRQAGPEEPGVVGERYPHGIRTVIVVPWPGGLSTVSSPSSARARSRMLAMPRPVAPAPPIPLSLISTTRAPSGIRMSTVAWLARACLTTLVRASQATK